MSRRSAYACAVVVFLLLVLAGCGPIGRSAPKECIPVQYFCVQPEEFDKAAATAAREHQDDPSFRNQWHLAYIKADEAYGNLAVLKGPDAEPGAGVTIGIMHAGIDLHHPAFAGKKVTETFLDGAVDESGEESVSYGTAVASVAAGARTGDEDTPHGVAWGADIAMFAIPTSRVSGPQLEPLARLASADASHAARYEQVLSWRDGERKVDILTLPLGLASGIDGFTEQDLRDNYGRAIAALAQADAEEKTILVWAAGEFHGLRCDPSVTDNCRYGYLDAVSPNVLAGLAARIEELRSYSIVVAGVSRVDGEMSSFSNRCGVAADYCVAAPAEDIGVAYFGPNRAGEAVRAYFQDYWTQYSAAMVSGGLAIMKQLFRDRLSNTEVVARLLETADNSGVYADRSLYGRGLVDLGAATSPVGVLEVPVGMDVGQSGFRLLSTSISTGTAFGDGLRRSLASREVMAVDRLGAPFWYRLGDFTGAAGGPSVSERLRGFLKRDSTWSEAGEGRQTASVAFHALEAPSDVRGSHMSLAEGAVQATLGARNGVSAAAFTTKGLPGQRPTVGAALSWRRTGSPWGVRAGWIGEPRTLLGSVGEGGFGGLAADTSFLGVDAHTELGGWRLGANAELGIVVPDARGGFVDRVSSLATSAFALHASRPLAGAGAVRFSVSQPLRVERGRASLTVPVSRTRAGAVSYDALSAGLSPSGRQMDFSGEWLRPLPKGELRLGAVYSHRPGHRKDAGPELTFLGGWRWAF